MDNEVERLASEPMVDSPVAPTPIAGAPSTRPRLFKHPGRVAVIAITMLVVLNLGIVLANVSDTSPGGTNLPPNVESVTPAPDELTGLVDTVSARLVTRYSGELVIDGIVIPEDELARTVSLNEISFRPGPDKAISRFRAGENTVVVRYWDGRVRDRPEKPPYSYSWKFRAAA